MSLLGDIQNDAIDTKVNISVILRKCKVLAARLGNESFEKWVDEELNGYKNVDSLPDYRIIKVSSKGHFSGFAGSSLRNIGIPLMCIPKEFRENLRKYYFTQPIAAYVTLLKNSKGDNFEEHWPPDLIACVGGKMYQDMSCIAAWQDIPHTSIISLVEAVRNRILNFVLEIEKEAPDAGEAKPSEQPISQEKVTQVFNTTIYSNVGNIAEGSQHVKQTATINVIENDFESLKTFLLSVGIPQKEVETLDEAISQDSSMEVKKTKSLGSKVLNWTGSIASKTAQGTFSIAKKVSITLITQAILMYYGIN